jgi:putative tricarboxylic transport membrane protein
MEALHSLFMGFDVFFTPYNLMIATAGIFLGAIVGVLPGLGVANGVAILIPMTFHMSPNSAIILLAAIYWGGLFGGVITSILFNIPGEPWSVATTFDGYPMARKGQAAKDAHLLRAGGRRVLAQVRPARDVRGHAADLQRPGGPGG